MRQILDIAVKESVVELKRLQKQHPSKHKALHMLLLLRKRGAVSKNDLALLTGASDKSIQIWRTGYALNGIDFLLKEKRGGRKPAAINADIHQQLSTRLNNPQQGFRSFIEIQHWLETEFKVVMNYHAVNKYVKRKFGARLKVSRKSHVLKSPAAEAVFKKPVRDL